MLGKNRQIEVLKKEKKKNYQKIEKDESKSCDESFEDGYYCDCACDEKKKKKMKLSKALDSTSKMDPFVY